VLEAAIHGEVERISQALTQRVKELVERYEMPLPQQASKVAELEQRVNAHLAKMGFSVY
jgi:type I restriction enzyme M protein